jgi:serine/threonine protein kinase
VWAAQVNGRLVAVKIVGGEVEAELDGLGRIKLAAHPHVLEIISAEFRDEDAHAPLLIVTELADGSLEDCFESLPADWTLMHRCVQAITLLRDVAEALDHLQRHHRLMHLDVKPANLLLVSGRCKLGDFGTVTRMRAEGTSPGEVWLAWPDGAGRATIRYRSLQEVPWQRVTDPETTLYTGAGACTPYYAAPEILLRGRASRSSDQYSLALTFCRLAAGGSPFTGGCETQLAQKAAGRMDLGLLPASLRPPVRRALSANPGKRFPTCLDFMTALRDALTPQDRLRYQRFDLPRHSSGTVPVLPRLTKADGAAEARPSGEVRRSSATVRPLSALPAADVSASDRGKAGTRPWRRWAREAAVVLRRMACAPVFAVSCLLGWGRARMDAPRRPGESGGRTPP